MLSLRGGGSCPSCPPPFATPLKLCKSEGKLMSGSNYVKPEKEDFFEIFLLINVLRIRKNSSYSMYRNNYDQDFTPMSQSSFSYELSDIQGHWEHWKINNSVC